jgi:hypothetical protein
MTTGEEPEGLVPPGLHDRAVHLAMRRMDIGFLWELLREPPASDPLCLDYLERHPN